MTKSYPIEFGPDKSQIVRAFAIIFMICLHNDTLPEFKICVPMFTFLVGYGYSFALQKNIKHGVKRSWHLLSHFWLILLGVFLPVSVLAGGYKPTMENVFLNMFGLESNLNWYSWYIYFYIFAMIILVPASRVIIRFRIWGAMFLIIFSLVFAFSIRLIPNWEHNIWIQALFDCMLCSPCMYSGLYLAEGGVVTKICISKSIWRALSLILLMVVIFFVRHINYATFLDFVLVPIFVIAIVALFNIIKTDWLHRCLISIGKQSMNMWFLHALFATSCTAMIFAPIIDWIQPKIVLIVAMCAISYCGGKIANKVYNLIKL